MDDAKKQIDTRILNPNYDAAKAITEEPMPTPSITPTPNPEDDLKAALDELAATLPSTLEFKLSEAEPRDDKEYPLSLDPKFGDLLLKAEVSGDAKAYVKATISGPNNGEYSLKIKADVSKAKGTDGRITFDSKIASVSVKMGTAAYPQAKEKKTTVKLTITHVLPADVDVEPPETSASEPTDKQPSTWLQCPVTGRISSGFGVMRSDGKHMGVDWVPGAGTPVKAAAAGKVVRAYTDPTNTHSTKCPNCGTGALIEHWLSDGSSVYTLYCHFEAGSLTVKVDDYVEAGQSIGAVGETGCADGAHLHFEVIDVESGRKLDPTRYTGYCDGRQQYSGWHENVYATYFGCGSDAQDMASGIYSTSATNYAALPDGYALRKKIEVRNPANGKSVVLDVLDIGPFCTLDSDYVIYGSRPFAEKNKGVVLGTLDRSCNRKYKALNGAGIDLSCDASEQLFGSKTNGPVDWRFVG
ncbi:Peptidase family M23 [Candidatus Norongarragalina meridionalis]|nr:Peptidase family M23 [Candidatus Norongarragalina meridionalis]